MPLAVALLQWLPAAAHAELEQQQPPYVAILLALGFGGSLDAETTVVGFTGSGEADLEPSFGGALAYMHPLHEYFVLGGQIGGLAWIDEGADNANQDRNVMADLLVVPQGRYGVTDDIELTLSLPLGLVVDFWGGESASVQAGGMTVASADVSPAFGFELGLLLGARFAVSSDVGLIAQLGYVAQWFQHDFEVTAGGFSGELGVDMSLGQPRLQLGVAF